MRTWSLLLPMTICVLASVGPARAEDREIAEQIARKLQASGQLRAYNILVKVEHGTAWLRGRVADQQQMNAAVELALQTKGVEQVANGLTIRTGPEQRLGTATIASRQPVDSAVGQARLMPRAPAPVPIAAVHPTPGPSALQRPVVPKSAPYTSKVDQASTLAETASPDRSVSAHRVRSPEFSSSLEAMPCTVQKAYYCASAGPMHAKDLHTVATFTGAAELMLLPDDSGALAGEAFASDGSEGPPALLDTTREDRSTSCTSLVNSTQPSLSQPLPEPSRRTWAETFRQRGTPTMQALLESQP